MGENSGIEWTTHTFNPWHGCQKVSPGCTNCYAMTLSRRWGKDIWGPPTTTARQTMAPAYWQAPIKKWEPTAKALHEATGERTRVFCASMADVFEAHPTAEQERPRLWDLIEQTPHLDWLLLTKRPEHILNMIPAAWQASPRPNVWYGTSVESQEYANKRIPELLKVPGVVRFLSCEPLLGPVDLLGHLYQHFAADDPRYHPRRNGVDWVIAGGESGHGARLGYPDWYRDLRDQCVTAGVPFHFKQYGEYLPLASADEASHYPASALVEGDGVRFVRVGKKAAGRLLDGRTWDEYPEVQP